MDKEDASRVSVGEINPETGLKKTNHGASDTRYKILALRKSISDLSDINDNPWETQRMSTRKPERESMDGEKLDEKLDETKSEKAIKELRKSNERKEERAFPIYKYKDLIIANGVLPSKADRNNLEYHLSDEEFEEIFHMIKKDFYSLPEWKRNDMKTKAGLFLVNDFKDLKSMYKF